jgi:hypothetical protein
MDSFVVVVIILFILVVGIIILLNIYSNKNNSKYNNETYENIGYPNSPYDSTPINKIIFHTDDSNVKTFLNRNDGMDVNIDYKYDFDRMRFPDSDGHVDYSPYQCKIKVPKDSQNTPVSVPSMYAPSYEGNRIEKFSLDTDYDRSIADVLNSDVRDNDSEYREINKEINQGLINELEYTPEPNKPVGYIPGYVSEKQIRNEKLNTNIGRIIPPLNPPVIKDVNGNVCLNKSLNRLHAHGSIPYKNLDVCGQLTSNIDGVKYGMDPADFYRKDFRPIPAENIDTARFKGFNYGDYGEAASPADIGRIPLEKTNNYPVGVNYAFT